ncbi:MULTISPECIES: DUF1918 domain-containing protein [unclassified Crossiella]|uniref:DUF1918 domain-containing protein n=1 Tax=unclassified Crossiella TaxID=2620835 RepID=UPI001FFE8817|nr:MULTISPECIES: DUF1918 domain-containing protein [unclassified Crossiella]MCK2242976.1 DUF1918 domain-containing protein [Crossiella sp. S99.2]MCK2256853.1 DUF1918 domain-containing protein [Crossiella sp. S99.1]
MRASIGDQLTVHGRIVGTSNRVLEVVEVLGADGTPPYRVRAEDGHESIMMPGPDCVVRPRTEP